MDDSYKNIDDYNTNKKLNPIVTELFFWGRNLNISLAFITQSYIAVPKDIRLNYTQYFFMKISNKWELQQIASQNSLQIDFQDFMYESLQKRYQKTISFFSYW